MLLTDPEVESSLLISLDEGASYQKHSLAFDILSLLFHPEQEDWILAYSHDQKVTPKAVRCRRNGKGWAVGGGVGGKKKSQKGRVNTIAGWKQKVMLIVHSLVPRETSVRL